ncbi:MAG: PepSY domain-containing protein [Albidovulum sp.]
MRMLPAVALVAALLPGVALAEELCVLAEGETAKTEDEVKAHAEGLGFAVANLKTEDGCYEVYATDTVGTKLEVFFHPATFKIAKVKVDS